MPVKVLPSNPNLHHLKHQAKDLLKQHAAGLPEDAQKIREFHPRFAACDDAAIFSAPLSLSDAQLTIARSHGFATWARLKRHIEKPGLGDQLHLPHHERIEDPAFRLAVDLLDTGDTPGLRTLLQLSPKLVHQRMLFEGKNYFRAPSLLEFIAENPVRHGKLPANIVEVTRVILDAGPGIEARNETLMLVATGSVPRECKVQRRLIALLCQHGADPNKAILSAATLGEHEAVRALIDQGAKVDLAVAAALGRADEFGHLLRTATPEERCVALALAAQFGHRDIVRTLLEAGEDPDRYNPAGGHAHSTPLHEAALAGHEEVVRLLLQRGARLDLKDTLFHGTPADWAEHAGRVELAYYLREQEKGRRLETEQIRKED